MSSGRRSSPSIITLGMKRGKTMSSSVSNISIRYHAEDEQLEELYDIDTRYETHSDDGRLSLSTASCGSISETSPDSGKGSSVLSKFGKRSSSLETGSGKSEESCPGDTWRLFREVRGRITKTVEEKIEEIKSERRLRSSRSKDRRSRLGQMENSSVSDSEDQSESSVSLKEPASPEKTTVKNDAPEKIGKLALSLADKSKEETDESVSQNSSPDRSVTPVPLVSVEDSEEQSGKKDKSKDSQKKQKLMPVNEEEAHSVQGVTYSSLWDKDADDERPLEIGLEATEVISSVGPYFECLREDDICKVEQNQKYVLDWMKNTFRLIYKWRSFIVPVIAVLVYFVKDIQSHLLGFMVGVVVTYELRFLFDWFANVFGLSTYSTVQESDLEPNFTTDRVPIFKNNIYRAPSLHPEKVKYEGWMNEFSREYSPKIYHISLTESVYVRLEGSTLRLSTPRNKIPKRAMWNEPKHKLLFNRDRLFDIANCRVTLLPEGLIHRRVWSKKYPICIRLLPLSRKGVRYRSSGQETVDETVAWLEEEKYSAETASVESDDSEEDKKSEYGEADPLILPDNSKRASEVSSTLSVNTEFAGADEDTDDEFVRVSPSILDEANLYLFARTDREKEIWYRRLVAAITYTSPSMAEMVSAESVSEAIDRKEARLEMERNYLNFLLQLSQRQIPNASSSSASKRKDAVNTSNVQLFAGVISTQSKSKSKTDNEDGESLISPDAIWMNAFCGRILYDVLQDQHLLSKIQEKIQRKLSAIRLPFFMEELVIRNIDFGLKVPIVQNVTRPELNSEGVWVDLNIFYEGGFKMVVDTKLNLMKLKRPQVPFVHSDNESSPKQSPAKSSTTDSPGPLKSAVFDSDVEDSAETSSEEPDFTRLTNAAEFNTPPAGGKYMRMLDKFAQSKYFQQMTDYKFVKNLMEGVSNTNITLDVEVKGLSGTLVLNFPPPPSDRLWYGFRTNPKLSLSAHPKFGERAVTIMNITKLIEKKLCLEFQKILVLPNMDDLLIPLMNKDLPS